MLVLVMAATVFYGVLKLKRMQADYLQRPPVTAKIKQRQAAKTRKTRTEGHSHVVDQLSR